MKYKFQVTITVNNADGKNVYDSRTEEVAGELSTEDVQRLLYLVGVEAKRLGEKEEA